MIKYTRDEQERLHLQEALRVMLNILSNLNDVMHSTQIIGYSVRFFARISRDKKRKPSFLLGKFEYLRSNAFACRKLLDIERETSWNSLYSDENEYKRYILVRKRPFTM